MAYRGNSKFLNVDNVYDIRTIDDVIKKYEEIVYTI